VQAPRINGLDAFVSHGGVGNTPLLSWSAPALGSANAYSVSLWNGQQNLLMATIFSGTSLRVPPGPLNGQEFVAVISAISAPFYSIDMAINRAGTPYYQADCVTAAFTP